jgi:hypothetical protein
VPLAAIQKNLLQKQMQGIAATAVDGQSTIYACLCFVCNEMQEINSAGFNDVGAGSVAHN